MCTAAAQRAAICCAHHLSTCTPATAPGCLLCATPCCRLAQHCSPPLPPVPALAPTSPAACSTLQSVIDQTYQATIAIETDQAFMAKFGTAEAAIDYMGECLAAGGRCGRTNAFPPCGSTYYALLSCCMRPHHMEPYHLLIHMQASCWDWQMLSTAGRLGLTSFSVRAPPPYATRCCRCCPPLLGPPLLLPPLPLGPPLLLPPLFTPLLLLLGR